METSNARRRLLLAAVMALSKEAGFDSGDRMALESLTEMLQAFLFEAGRNSRAYCEIAGRTEPIASDVYVGISDMGFDWSGFETYVKRSHKPVLPPQTQLVQTKQSSILQIGDKKPHPSHIPDHLPVFPDSHSYIRTPTHKKPVTEYEAIREKASSQKREVERALTRFIAKTGEMQSLFHNEDNVIFPLIACKPMSYPFLAALLPKDQDFDDIEGEKTFWQQKKDRMKALSMKSFPESEDASECDRDDSAMETDLNKSGSSLQESGDEREVTAPQPKHRPDVGSDVDPIDNPYLRSVKMPSLARKK